MLGAVILTLTIAVFAIVAAGGGFIVLFGFYVCTDNESVHSRNRLEGSICIIFGLAWVAVWAVLGLGAQGEIMRRFFALAGA